MRHIDELDRLVSLYDDRATLGRCGPEPRELLVFCREIPFLEPFETGNLEYHDSLRLPSAFL
jgi:hypothetical protein